MAVYTVRIGKNEYKVEFKSGQVMVNGQPMGVQIRKLNEQGLVLLQRGGKKMEVMLSPRENNQVSLVANRRHLTANVTRGAGRRNTSSVADGTLAAPMPGTVVEVKVAEGQDVVKGQVVAILESMKMQMEIRSPINGIITKILAASGGKIEKGKPLALVVPVPA